MQKQFEYKNWEATFSLCHQIGIFGSIALPFHVGWFYSKGDLLDPGTCFEISIDFLCFTFDVEVWKWAKGA